MKKEKIIEWVWFLAVVILFIVSFKMIKSGELQSQVESLGFFAPFFIIFIKMATLIVAPLGGTPIYVLSGALFGSFKGFIVAIIGDILGSSVCFYLSRSYGQRFLSSLVGSQNLTKILKAVNVINSNKSFAKARLGFVGMPELLSYAAGLSKISFWSFTLINTAFYVPMDILMVLLGSSIADLSVKYFFVIPLIIFTAFIVGFFLIYKDYEKIESM